MKKILALLLITACVAGLFAGCSGKIDKDSTELDSNTVVTEDPTRNRTIYGNIEQSRIHFTYEVLDPYEQAPDGSDKVAGSYIIYCDTDNLEEALREKRLVFMNEYGNIIVEKYTDLSGGKWVCFVNGQATKKDITKMTIEEGTVYSFKFVKD
jgi:hypothetical protein